MRSDLAFAKPRFISGCRDYYLLGIFHCKYIDKRLFDIICIVQGTKVQNVYLARLPFCSASIFFIILKFSAGNLQVDFLDLDGNGTEKL